MWSRGFLAFLAQPDGPFGNGIHRAAAVPNRYGALARQNGRQMLKADGDTNAVNRHCWGDHPVTIHRHSTIFSERLVRKTAPQRIAGAAFGLFH
jgi:hypothetical protein